MQRFTEREVAAMIDRSVRITFVEGGFETEVGPAVEVAVPEPTHAAPETRQ